MRCRAREPGPDCLHCLDDPAELPLETRPYGYEVLCVARPVPASRDVYEEVRDSTMSVGSPAHEAGQLGTTHVIHYLSAEWRFKAMEADVFAERRMWRNAASAAL